MGRRPDFLIIGAMKCATSTLHEQLGQQPGLFTTALKEPGYFSHPEVHARGPEWYASLFADAAPGDLCGESSTHYTKLPTYPDTLARIQQELGRVKLVYLMRHPVERLVSHYVYEWTGRRLSGSLDEAPARHPEVVDYGRYAMQLEPYLAAFGREAVLPVFQERLAVAPQAELERICQFLGRPEPTGSEPPRWIEGLESRNVSSERLRRSAIRDVLVAAPVLAPLRRWLVPRALAERAKQWWQLREKPALGDARRRELEAVFDEDLARLGAWLGVELRCEGFAETVSRASLEWSAGAP